MSKILLFHRNFLSLDAVLSLLRAVVFLCRIASDKRQSFAPIVYQHFSNLYTPQIPYCRIIPSKKVIIEKYIREKIHNTSTHSSTRLPSLLSIIALYGLNTNQP